MTARILIVDDEQVFLSSVRRGLRGAGFTNIVTLNNPSEVPDLLNKNIPFDVALIDITMPGLSGLDLLPIIRSKSPSTECIMVSAINEVKTALSCLKSGAYDYMVKPITSDDLIHVIQRALERKKLLEIMDLGKSKLPSKFEHPEVFKDIITQSKEMLKILKEAELHAASDMPVLITGESGTGKELLAKAIHAASMRAGNLFMPVNMAAITPSLFDAEFFGHTKGAFTGADKERIGYLESTHRGTLFLDEIGTLPTELQGKLLRVFQEGEYIKIGTNVPKICDVRFIAATNEKIESMIARGLFRKDLFYRLRGAWLHLPPLRKRKEDIPLLIERFLPVSCATKEQACIDKEALSILEAYDYPGNIRELGGIVQAAVNLSRGGVITKTHLPAFLRDLKAPQKRSDNVITSGLTLAEVEMAHILQTYEALKNNKSATARQLDISLNTLRKKLGAYGRT